MLHKYKTDSKWTCQVMKEITGKLKKNQIFSPKNLKLIKLKNFKASSQQGIFPDSLNVAKETPIFKSRDKNNGINYCPVSILSVFSKVLERVMRSMR